MIGPNGECSMSDVSECRNRLPWALGSHQNAQAIWIAGGRNAIDTVDGVWQTSDALVQGVWMHDIADLRTVVNWQRGWPTFSWKEGSVTVWDTYRKLCAFISSDGRDDCTEQMWSEDASYLLGCHTKNAGVGTMW
jgi:hypothetical protein